MHLPWFKVILAFVMGFLSAQGFSQTVVAQVLIRDTVDVQTPDPSLILSEYVPIPENGFYSIIYNQTFRNPPGNYLRDDNIYTWEGKSITLSASNKTITHDLGAVLPIVFKQRNETNLCYQGGESYPVWAYTSEASGSEYLGYLSAGSVFISLQGSDAELFASYGPDDGLATGFWQMKYRSPINYRCPSQNFIPSGGGRFEDWLEFGFEKVTPEFEVIPEDSIVYVSDKTTLHVTTTLSGFSGNLDLRVSDATLGYLALMDVAGDGTEFIVKQGSGLSDIPYAVLEKENTTTSEYVVFIAGELPLLVKQQNGNFVNDSTQQNEPRVQIFASLSDDPENEIVGFGEVEIKEPTIEILNADSVVASYLDIANWEKAYYLQDEATSLYLVRNEKEVHLAEGVENFVDHDPERFYIKVTDFSKREDPDFKDTLSTEVTIETGILKLPYAIPKIIDEKTTIHLVEDEKNSGVFISEALILTAPDIQVPLEVRSLGDPELWVSDDDFKVHDNITGVVEDDYPNDRTHQAEIGGTVYVEYTTSLSTVKSSEVPVCEDIKTVKYQFVTFYEPFDDVGLDGLGPGDDGYTGPDADGSEGNGKFDCVGAVAVNENDSGCKALHVNGVVSEPYFNLSRLYEQPDYLSHNGPGPLEPTAGSETMFDSDAYGGIATQKITNRFIEDTRRAWAQACIEFEEVTPLRTIDAPQDTAGKDIFLDQVSNIDIPDGKEYPDTYTVYWKEQSSMANNIVYIYWGPPFYPYKADLEAFSYTPFTWNQAEEIWKTQEGCIEIPTGTNRHRIRLFSILGKTQMYLSPIARPMTLAHEFGHILTRVPCHSENKERHIIFPETHFLSNGKDYSPLANYQVNMRRRLKKSTIELARQSPLLIEHQ